MVASSASDPPQTRACITRSCFVPLQQNCFSVNDTFEHAPWRYKYPDRTQWVMMSATFRHRATVIDTFVPFRLKHLEAMLARYHQHGQLLRSRVLPQPCPTDHVIKLIARPWHSHVCSQKPGLSEPPEMPRTQQVLRLPHLELPHVEPHKFHKDDCTYHTLRPTSSTRNTAPTTPSAPQVP